MLRRMLLAAIGLAAAVCLGGCVVHGHGPNAVHTRATHHARVFNVTSQSHPHAHDNSARNHHDDPAHHRGYHEDGDRGHRRSHGRTRRESRGNNKD